ncbi:hypothetical protein LSCM4_05847 [Leishmania orientalis]|uniref:Uncharacterized protein n=1 Tax=Leishmania orientalis TaxID=2249476 RepID=A0A836KLD1_9TRYP|nr:hypothetical protein LSCM4_05847 [Leishmania orientalis]
MLSQSFTALQRLQQQRQELVDDATVPAKSSSHQQLTSMPSALSEGLHEFYRAHAQLGPHQKQRPPPARVHESQQLAQSNVLANERFSASVARSHSRDSNSAPGALVQRHHDGKTNPLNYQGQPARQCPGKGYSTGLFSGDGERAKSFSPMRSASPPGSVATAAPLLHPEVPIAATLEVVPAPPLAPSQDRRQRSAEVRVEAHCRPAALRHRDRSGTPIALPPSCTRVAACTASHSAPLSSPSAAEVGECSLTSSSGLADELQRTREKLAELQRLYAFEKQAYLRQRNRQLREEAQLRQADDDITERTAQLLTDYESLMRFRDSASREHLESVLQRVTDEWKRNAENLEETRAKCEVALLSRLQTALVEQQDALAKRLQQHLVSVAKSTVETERAQHAVIAAAVQEQVESFKEEYRRVLEEDMAERQRLMDEQVAHRESQWHSFLKEEHARMIASGEAAAREASRRQLETLHLAMRDITALREQLLHEHTRREAQVAQEYLSAYESLASEYVTSTEETTEYVLRLQRDYANIIRALHEEVNRMSVEKQEAVRQAEQCALQVAEAVAQQLRAVEEKADSRWQARCAAELEAHRAAVQRLSLMHEEAMERERSSSAAKEAELKQEYEREHAAREERLARQQEQMTAAADKALHNVQAAVQSLEREKEGLLAHIQELKNQLRREELAREAAVHDARQAAEARYTSQLSSLEATYDAVLQQYKEKLKTACSGSDSSSAGFTNATVALKRVAELERELQEAQAEHATRVQQAVSEAVVLWSARLEECRQQRQADCNAMEQQHRALRAALLEEVQQREQALEQKCLAQRRAHQEELHDVIRREKEASHRALERLEQQHAAAQRHLEAEAERRVRASEDALAVREKQLEVAEAQWQRRRTEDNEAALRQLTAHVTAQHAKQLAELEEQEATLRSERAQLAQQQVVMEHEIRRAIQGEMEMRLAKQLAVAEEGWARLLEAELLQRFTTWQEFRMQELACVQQLHRQEVRLLDEHHAAQIAALQEAHQLHLSQEAEAMRAREVAWAAARTASLDAYGEAAAAKLQEVLAVEQSQWHTAQQQHAAKRGAIIEAAAARIAEHLTITEATRAQLEEEVRSSYLPILEQQQAKTSALLAEQRRRHEEAIAQVRASCAAQLEKDIDACEREHEVHVQEVREALEQQLAAQRSQHAAARKAYEEAASARMRDVCRLHEQQISELQQRCDALASQRCAAEAASYRQAQRAQVEQEAKLRAEYEECIAGLRHTIEERNQSYADLQASLYVRVQSEADRIQAAADEKLARFMEHHQKQLAELLLAHETALAKQQQRQQEELARLRARHEADLTAQACQLRKEHEATEAALQSSWESQLESWRNLLEDERRERRAADERAKAAVAAAAELRVASEQQQAATYRALDNEYRGLLEQMRHDVQVEREELARRCLEEEEQRFAAEMLQRAHAHRHPTQAQSWQQPNASAYPFATVDTPVLVAAPESPTPLARRRSSGAPTFSAVSTPAALYPVTSEESPLPISPAAPVELPAAHPHDSRRRNHDHQLCEAVLLKAKERLRQLWDVLEVPSDDQCTFLSYVDSLAEEVPAADLQDVLTREQRRLEAQLPLLEALTRREYVQRQLRTLIHAPPLKALSINKSNTTRKRVGRGDSDDDNNGAVHVTVSASSPSFSQVFGNAEESGSISAAVSPPSKMRGEADSKQLEQLQLELRRLTEQLRHDITQHEKEFGQLFCIKGTRVMDAL